MASLDALQRIEEKVTQVYDVVVGGQISGPILQRVEKLEAACFSGSGAGLIVSSAAIAEVISSTNFVTGVSGWRIQKSGNVEFQSGTFRGDITASSGFFSGTVYVGATSNRIIIDGPNKLLKSENYVAGVSGWQIDGLGKAEFEDVIIRGTFHSSVFSYNEISTIGGRQLIAPAAGTLRTDVTTVASPTTFNVDITDPDSGHVQLFAVADRLRITDAGVTNWLTVSSVSDQTTFYRYVCVLADGSATTFRKGTGVTNYGASGDGVIILDAQSATGPFISVKTHAGSPWSTETEKVRIGNLNGSFGIIVDNYGLAFGDYAGGNYMLMTTNAPAQFNLVSASGDLSIDEIGMTIKAGTGFSQMVRWISSIDLDPIAELYVHEDVPSNYTTFWINHSSPNTTFGQLSLSTDYSVVHLIDNASYADLLFRSLVAGQDSRLTVGRETANGEQGDVVVIGKNNSNYGGRIVLRNTPASTILESYLQIQSNGDFKVWAFDGTTARGAITVRNSDAYVQLNTGDFVNEFSIDGTMADNSDSALPTEKAIVTYVAARAEKSVVNRLYHSLTHYIWPEGDTFNDITDDSYVAGVWNVLHNGQNPDITSVASSSSQHHTRFLRCTFDSASSKVAFVQFLTAEDTRPLRGGKVSIQASVWGTNVSALRMSVLSWTGTADTLTSDVIATWAVGNPTLATDWAYAFTPSVSLEVLSSEVTLAIQDITIPTTAVNIAIMIWTPTEEASGDVLNIANVSMEIGAQATAFVSRVKTDEIKLVQHFVRVLDSSSNNATIMNGAKFSTTGVVVLGQNLVTMRIAPTLSHNITGYTAGAPGTTTVALFDLGTGAFMTITGALTLTLAAANPEQLSVLLTAGTSWSGTAGDLCQFRIGPDVRAVFSARL